MSAIRTAAILILLLVTVGCRDEDTVITASIEGRWTGTLAEVQVKPFGLPVPFKEDDDSFATVVEFRSDGTLVFYEDDVGRHGTYTVTGDQLTIETDYTVEDIAISGTYTIQTLTETNLVMFLKRKDEVVDADGMPAVKGHIKITLHFMRS